MSQHQLNKRVILTGATGFIGSHAISTLLNSGYEVHAPYIGPCGENQEGLHWHECNLMAPQELEQLFSEVKPTDLLHFAWYAIPGKYWTAVENLHWVTTTLKLVEEFKKAGGSRVVCAGTCAEYLWDNTICDVNKTPLKPHSLYGTAKASLYQILSSYCNLNDLSFAWGRIFFLYGNREPKNRFIPSIITHLLEGKDVPCSHGQQIRDFMHVQDVANAFVALLQSDFRGATNIASGQPIKLKDAIELITSKIDSPAKPLFGAIPTGSNDPESIIADISQLNSIIGWKPQFTLEEGIDETIAYWKKALATV